jgi:hypothetical protein
MLHCRERSILLLRRVLFGDSFNGRCRPIAFAGTRYAVVLAIWRPIGLAVVLVDPVGRVTASLIGSR